MDVFNLKHNFSFHDRSFMIDSAVKSLDSDLEIVSSEGAILRANFYLISKASPLLKGLFPTDKSVPARIHLPDVSKDVISHLINIVKHGFTTGQGPVNSITREIQEAARVLGFTEVPVLTYDEEGEEEEMSSSSQAFDEGDVEITGETQKEHNGNANDSDKSYEHDIEMVVTLKKIEEIKVKVVSWLKSLEKKVKEGHVEGMKLLLALDGIKKYEQHRIIRKDLVRRIESGLDIGDDFTREIQKLAFNSGFIPKEISLQGVNKNVANRCNDGNDVNRVTTSPNDESMEVIYTIGEKKKPESKDTSPKSNKLNIGDDLMINSGDDKDEEEVNSKVIGMVKSDQSTYPQSSLKECYVFLERSKVQIQNIKPPMISAAKRRRLISKPEENNIEIKEKSYNNCEVREVITEKLKVEPATGEDVINGENGNILLVTCEACKKMFTNASTLLVHSEKHHGEGKGTRYCQFCTYTGTSYTGNRTDMLKHLRAKHTGEKLFKSNSCEARFATCKMLRSHVKSNH